MEIFIFFVLILVVSSIFKAFESDKDTKHTYTDYDDIKYTGKLYTPGSKSKEELDIPIADKYEDTFSRQKYEEYLKSDKWYALKNDRLIIDDYRCQQCDTPVTYETSNCHHITYRNLCNEKLFEVVTLCFECHEKIHAFHGKNAINYPLLDGKNHL